MEALGFVRDLWEEDEEARLGHVPKKAASILQKLDELRSKIKGKAIADEPKAADEPNEEQPDAPSLTAKENITKKVWIEKRKPSREDTEKVDEALNLNKQLEEGLTPVENIESASRAVKEVLEAQCVEGSVSVVRDSEPDDVTSRQPEIEEGNQKEGD
ncbi:hypothetical protein RIF29_33381 [Crotalaria pallida]|uniref:Uncharacterized protein n=1 Tax=Crotalaria pallida TaxID=3830 RepID=A0AAN9E9Y8_CROPI